MALDIELDNESAESGSVRLDFREFSIVVDVIKEKEFPLLKRALSNFFGDNEIYLSELNDLKYELNKLTDILETSIDPLVNNFITDLLNLIDKAVEFNKTIKFIGD